MVSRPTSRAAASPNPRSVSAAPSIAAQPELRAFGDAAATRRLIFDNALKAAQEIEPVSNPRHSLSVANVRYEGPDKYTLAQQKQALLTGGSLNRRLVGDWVLADATGQELARKKATLARIPYFTDRGTFILNGSDWTAAHQFRLRPGVYAREKENGDYEAHLNVSKGFGHRIHLDPSKGVFKIDIGQAQIPLLPLLKAMGVPESHLRKKWGSELLAINQQKADTTAIKKLFEKLHRDKELPADAESMQQAVVQAFQAMELDPEVTERTLGKAYKNVDADAILDTTAKLLKIAQGKADHDDRDAMEFQSIMGPEDYFAERIKKAKMVARQILWRASATGKLDKVPTNAYGDAVLSALMGSGLGQPLEEVNLGEVFDQQVRVTRMGEGGITSGDSVPDESRSVQPSQFGFVDPVRPPECYDRQTEVMTRRGWIFWPEAREDDEFACLVEGVLHFYSAQRLFRRRYAGPMYGADTGRISYLVTPNHRLWVRPLFKGSQYRFELAENCGGKFRLMRSGGFAPYAGDGPETFRLPRVERRSNNEFVVDQLPIGPWCSLMGWWLGEGNCVYCENGSAPTYKIKVTQSCQANPENCDRIKATLQELPFSWSYSDRAFNISTKQVAAYFRRFGRQESRFIPEELLRAPLAARRQLYEALLYGEGRRDRRGDRTQFCTTSSRLADDFARLAFGLGYGTRKVWERDDREQSKQGGTWVVHIHKFNEHQLLPNRPRGNDYHVVMFDDDVFSAMVLGGLLYVRRGDTVGHWSGDSGRIGLAPQPARYAWQANAK